MRTRARTRSGICFCGQASASRWPFAHRRGQLVAPGSRFGHLTSSASGYLFVDERAFSCLVHGSAAPHDRRRGGGYPRTSDLSDAPRTVRPAVACPSVERLASGTRWRAGKKHMPCDPCCPRVGVDARCDVSHHARSCIMDILCGCSAQVGIVCCPSRQSGARRPALTAHGSRK